MSIETIWTADRTTPISEYFDWHKKPTIIKSKLLPITSIKWKRIIESIFLKRVPEGKNIKFCKKITCTANNKTIRGGQREVSGLLKINDSLEASFNKSTTTCNHPFRPAIAGPNLRWAKASNFRSVKTTKRVKIIKNRIKIKPKSNKIIHA